MESSIKVRLLVSRTGLGKAGDVVDYPGEDVTRHAAMGLVCPLVTPAAEQPGGGDSEDSDDAEPEAGETSHDDAPIASAPPSRKKRK